MRGVHASEHDNVRARGNVHLARVRADDERVEDAALDLLSRRRGVREGLVELRALVVAHAHGAVKAAHPKGRRTGNHSQADNQAKEHLGGKGHPAALGPRRDVLLARRGGLVLSPGPGVTVFRGLDGAHMAGTTCRCGGIGLEVLLEGGLKVVARTAARGHGGTHALGARGGKLVERHLRVSWLRVLRQVLVVTHDLPPPR